jgi:hypothetical protein
MKKSIEERLKEKSIAELKAIAKRIRFPLRANGKKPEHVQALNSIFNCKRTWKIISS